MSKGNKGKGKEYQEGKVLNDLILG